jgi:hypothetical protein
MIVNKEFEYNGFLREFHVELGPLLKDLQEKVYAFTKTILIDHDRDLEIEKKIILPFKEIPSQKFWSDFMNDINNSEELNNLVSSLQIKNAFKKIFSNPIKFDICAFRARVPNQNRVIYNWHQDEGTWFLSKNKNLHKKYTATLWLSVNGSHEKNSIQLIKKSHKNKLFNHSFIDGQGYFKADNININNQDIYTVNTKISEALIFHPLTLHRSVTSQDDFTDMYPRYSIDIRYYDSEAELDYKTNLKFKIKKLLL